MLVQRMASPTPSTRGLISVVIPTLNEQFGIEKTISSIPRSQLRNELGYELEILVVDGNSTDSTAQVALKMGARVIVEKLRGYGRAYKTGFAASKGDIIVTIDADDTYPARQIPEFIRQLIHQDLDFITINRFARMERNSMDIIRRTGNRLLAFILRLLYSINLNDSQSGMWIMKAKFLSQINIYSDDMSMSEEIKIIAFKFFNSKEMDGTYFARTGSTKLDIIKHGWLNLRYLFQYKKMIKSALKSKKFVVKREMYLHHTSHRNDH